MSMSSKFAWPNHEKIAKGIWRKLMFSKEENMREDEYVNVLEHQQKQKFLEWMKNQSELAGNVACSSISRFVWHTMSKTWKPKMLSKLILLGKIS
ncbi:hypothetical protein HID58_041398 [Brassica napus]|uniref:Uncharacterized protein n=1 Tax=Brassica napus TaxID=3708 RepID=A0ABQ8BAP3_BRANA|nr:hypothetical protein HID58_041398 [Brassica napus]